MPRFTASALCCSTLSRPSTFQLQRHPVADFDGNSMMLHDCTRLLLKQVRDDKDRILVRVALAPLQSPFTWIASGVMSSSERAVPRGFLEWRASNAVCLRQTRMIVAMSF
jgi:hypothetical protein